MRKILARIITVSLKSGADTRRKSQSPSANIDKREKEEKEKKRKKKQKERNKKKKKRPSFFKRVAYTRRYAREALALGASSGRWGSPGKLMHLEIKVYPILRVRIMTFLFYSGRARGK